MCVVVACTSPFTILPSKASIEEGIGRPITNKQNVLLTLFLLLLCCAVAAPVTNIGTAMTFLGATTNSAIGFLFPIAYYLHVDKLQPKFTYKKMICYFIFAFICASSVITLYQLFSKSPSTY